MGRPRKGELPGGVCECGNRPRLGKGRGCASCTALEHYFPHGEPIARRQRELNQGGPNTLLLGRVQDFIRMNLIKVDKPNTPKDEQESAVGWSMSTNLDIFEDNLDD